MATMQSMTAGKENVFSNNWNTSSQALQYLSRPHGFAQVDDSSARSPVTEMIVRLHGLSVSKNVWWGVW
jgi:hypothetical protein